MKRPYGEKVPLVTKIFYGFGDIGFALTDTIIGLLFANFMIKVVGLSPSEAALAIFIGHTWDWINDPLFGALSDRMRSRWGRRRVFLLFGFIPLRWLFCRCGGYLPLTSIGCWSVIMRLLLYCMMLGRHWFICHIMR